MNILPKNLRIHNAHRAYCTPEWSWDNRVAAFTDFNFWFIASGKGHICIDTAEGRIERPLVPGDCFLLREAEHVQASHDPAHPLIVPYVIFSCSARGFSPDRYRRVMDARFQDQLLQRVIDAMEVGDARCAAQWAACAIEEMFRAPVLPVPPGVTDESAAAIRRLGDEMRQAPGKWMGVDQVARALMCSKDHAIRQFRAVHGVTPNEFLIRARMREAQTLLRGSSLSIGAIAEVLGYSDIYFFSKQFRQRHGESPLEYRRRS